jgi:hypothetical protein
MAKGHMRFPSSVGCLVSCTQGGEGGRNGGQCLLHTPVCWAGRGRKGGSTVSHMAVHPHALLAQTQEWGKGGKGEPPPHLCAPLVCVHEQDARGRGGAVCLCFHALLGCRGPACAVLFNSAGVRGKRGGGVPFMHRPTFPVCTEPGWGEPCVWKGRRGGANEGAYRQGPCSKRGQGHANCLLHAPTPSVPPPFACCIARKGGRVGARGYHIPRGSPSLCPLHKWGRWCHAMQTCSHALSEGKQEAPVCT